MEYLLEGKETTRLLFRKLLPSDFGSWLPFHEEPLSTVHWIGGAQDPHLACEQWFQNIFYRYENQLGGLNALISKENGKLIGQAGLLVQSINGIQELEIGYSILPEYWRQGYATEAASMCKQHAFDNQLFPSLISIIPERNEGSKRVALKNGMHLDSTERYKNNKVAIFRVYPSHSQLSTPTAEPD